MGGQLTTLFEMETFKWCEQVYLNYEKINFISYPIIYCVVL